ncbi:UBC-like protein [Piedraia hortae CBS 480.64]|uniref:UBC-like protein n=1 Tax=Piedraia hortae CBS 480.64 TaxID=1314780 RepID=A0A6A7C6R6_9PEZI|nr:UBC-like protein [Piedraia hortae CBS 480.64]
MSGLKSPTIKRIMKEAAELASQPSSDYHATPLESDLFEWHFTLRGPPDPSPFANGVYHGRIVLPPAYPLKPPSFRFLTPTGRFEVNREICLSISGHHEETWQPAWGIRTALVALRSFMDTNASGQLGGLEAAESVRRRMASQSGEWKCPTCGKTNNEIMHGQEEAIKNSGDGEQEKGFAPPELTMTYKETLKESEVPNLTSTAPTSLNQTATDNPPPAEASGQVRAARPQRQAENERRRREWVDQAIYVIVIALAVLLWRQF